ncbi:MAG: hypothetical protein ACRC6A_11055 [Fusobacteriaceae bacterium]
MKKNDCSSFEEEINFDALLGDGKEIVFTTLEEDFSDLNGTDHTFKLEQIGIKNEEDKNKNKLSTLIGCLIYFEYSFCMHLKCTCKLQRTVKLTIKNEMKPIKSIKTNCIKQKENIMILRIYMSNSFI